MLRHRVDALCFSARHLRKAVRRTARPSAVGDEHTHAFGQSGTHQRHRGRKPSASSKRERRDGRRLCSRVCAAGWCRGERRSVRHSVWHAMELRGPAPHAVLGEAGRRPGCAASYAKPSGWAHRELGSGSAARTQSPTPSSSRSPSLGTVNGSAQTRGGWRWLEDCAHPPLEEAASRFPCSCHET